MVVTHVEARRIGRRVPEKDEVRVGYGVVAAAEVDGEGSNDMTRGASGSSEACPTLSSAPALISARPRLGASGISQDASAVKSWVYSSSSP